MKVFVLQDTFRDAKGIQSFAVLRGVYATEEKAKEAVDKFRPDASQIQKAMVLLDLADRRFTIYEMEVE